MGLIEDPKAGFCSHLCTQRRAGASSRRESGVRAIARPLGFAARTPRTQYAAYHEPCLALCVPAPARSRSAYGYRHRHRRRDQPRAGVFAAITAALIEAGHRVVIITFREHSQATVDELAGWGIRYSEVVCSSLDQCLEHGPDAWKAAMCREYGVDVFFDDDPAVLQHVDGETVCFMPRPNE